MHPYLLRSTLGRAQRGGPPRYEGRRTRLSHSPPQRKDLGPTQKLLLQLIAEDPSASVTDLANRMGRSVIVIRSMLRRLAEVHGIHLSVEGYTENPGGPTNV